VIADEQTAGRGRLNRRWYTPPGAALAASLIIKGQVLAAGPELIPRLTAWGALALSEALEALSQGEAAVQIKWPNDVLLAGRKVAGILAEAHWIGDHLSAAILGIGVNVHPKAVPPPAELIFPAISVEAGLGRPVDRLDVLYALLERLLAWRERLESPAFLSAWEARLAYRDEWVTVVRDEDSLEIQVLGLDPEGALLGRDRNGQELHLHFGEIRVRPQA
jgi:BirA family biotin operon repressor/biotin-[acetyl-CoA-carboxylase] ligase